MSIQQPDIKLLFSKAAGRCSMPDCRMLLSEPSETHALGNVLFGEICHIIGESKDGPRGNGLLPMEERNRYQNLILLCRNHHAIIDKDPNSWPVERLHKIKDDHEFWVNTTLHAQTLSVSDKIYSSIANLVSECLMLNKWYVITDGAINGNLPDLFIKGAVYLYTEIYKSNWPRTKPLIEEKAINLAERLNCYIQYYTLLAYKIDNNYWQEDKRWKAIMRPDYDKLQYESEKWNYTCFYLLWNLCKALSDFAFSIRSELNPNYFALDGQFVIHDSIGVTNNLKETTYRPDSYIEVKLFEADHNTLLPYRG
ncbi:HNH endonuclease signature motif containing protein [Vogesella indigofera]|uniref:HNH endonuclease signature motif containing protein n=1 Tax=Vogesella indigofera TaxID=45465 RepID=UPI00234D3037|nr:HNH endonuclease signature motif containing protein [Vogesella indigofera]MDC7704050.1 HNH endonuclease signature motif containing protein [Vogesella indigofera]